MSILEGELAEQIGEALIDADIPFALTVSRTEIVGGVPWDPGSGTPETVNYPAKGYVDTFEDSYIAGGLVQQGDVKVVIVANTLSITPVPGDKVTVRDETLNVINVSADPALALFEIQARQ